MIYFDLGITMNSCTAFAGNKQVAAGTLRDVVLAAKKAVDRGKTVLIFSDATSHVVEVHFRGTAAEVAARIPVEQEPPKRTGPGRPKLGVIAREVMLLPRHWEWLNSQPGGASVALRKLVEEA